MGICRLRAAICCAVALLASLAAAAAPAAPDLDAIVQFETRQTLASGVVRTEQWQERLVRRADRVWAERVLPAGSVTRHAHETAAEHAGHAHFNAEIAARWIERMPDGSVTLRLVDREHRQIVSVPVAEFQTVGFDGRFDAAGHLVPLALIAQMPVVARTADGEWRQQRVPGWTHRVLWSAQRQVALRIESASDDGTYKRSVRLEPRVVAESLPWATLGGYELREYVDFMD